MRREDLKRQVAISLFCAFAREGRGRYALAWEQPAYVCLSGRHREILFGNQPAETVFISGTRGTKRQIPVMEQEAERSLLRISFSEALQLGIKGLKLPGAGWRDSAACVLYGPEGKVTLESGVEPHCRHLHISPEHAKLYGLNPEDRVWAVIKSETRSLTFGNVNIQLDDQCSLELHLDTDEARAAGLTNGQCVEIVTEAP